MNLLENLQSLPPQQPEGRFRWPYYNWIARFHKHDPTPRTIQDSRRELLGELGRQHVELWKNAPEKVLEVFRRHAWELGQTSGESVAEKCWSQVSPETRGTYLASLTEYVYNPATLDWILGHLTDIAFNPESACQLAYNAVREKHDEILVALFNSNPDWDASVNVGYWRDEECDRTNEILDQLSPRLIDRVLEAALFCRRPGAVKAALRKGADPDIPFWTLEHDFKCGQKHSPLSYASYRGSLEIARILLDAGANPRGTAFTSVDFPLYCARGQNHFRIVDLLLARGARFTLG